MSGGRLYLVATPIGHLGDVTVRALETLRAVPLIAAEDTRVTRRLLERYEITTRTISFHARSGPDRLALLIEHLRTGADLALVSDAGTPGISDPGADLAGAWIGEGGRVEAIPGASAVLAALAVSGIAGPRWSFEGFLPRRGRDRRDRLDRLAADSRGCVIFESPRRVAGTIDDLLEACGPSRRVAICRELTKIHEQVVRGSLGEVAALLAAGAMPVLGEAVIVIGWADEVTLSNAPRTGGRTGAQPGADGDRDELAGARAMVEQLVAGGMARGEAARRVARETRLPRRRLYGTPESGARSGIDQGAGATGD